MRICQGGLISAICCIMEFSREASKSNASACYCCMFEFNRLIVRAFWCQDRFIYSNSRRRSRVNLAEEISNCLGPRTNRIVANYTWYRGFSNAATNSRHRAPRQVTSSPIGRFIRYSRCSSNAIRIRAACRIFRVVVILRILVLREAGENDFFCFRSETPFHRTCTEPGVGAAEGGPALADTCAPA